MPGPIATIGSMHVCPMCSGTVPHVGGPVVQSGAPGVLINGKPVALMGDICTCAGPPDTIVQGEVGVTVNGIPVATVGCMTAHGGSITMGEIGVTITSNTPQSIVTMEEADIPFPKISTLDKTLTFLSGNNLQEALSNQEKLKEPLYEELENIKLTTTFAVEQLQIMAKKDSLILFTYVIKRVFGNHYTNSTIKKLYKDAQANASLLNPKIIVTKGGNIGIGGPAGYSNKTNEIIVSENFVRKAKDDNDKRAELMVALVEEVGHHIHHLLHNVYTPQNERKNLPKKNRAIGDAGAKFSYQIIQINLLETSEQYFADLEIDGAKQTLVWDCKELHNNLTQYVNEARQNRDDNGEINFYKAGKINVNHGEYGHQDIEEVAMKDILINIYNFKKNDPIINTILHKIYLGNWMRDFSQVIDPAAVRPLANSIIKYAEKGTIIKTSDLSNVTIDRPSNKKTKVSVPYGVESAGFLSFDYNVIYKNLEVRPITWSREFLTSFVGVLALKEFAKPKDPKELDKENYDKRLESFKKEYLDITPEVLGVYRPDEHIDNPKTDPVDKNAHNPELNKPNEKYGFVGQATKVELAIGKTFGMKNYIRTHIRDANSLEFSTKRTAYEFVVQQLKEAQFNSKFNNITAMTKFGAALHVIEDYFAHTNFVEIAVAKVSNDRVFPWVDVVPNHTPYVGAIDFNYDKFARLEPREASTYLNLKATPSVIGISKIKIDENLKIRPNQIVRFVPIVTGTFGDLDMLASLLPLIEEKFFSIEIKPYEESKPGERTINDVLILEICKDLDQAQALDGNGTNNDLYQKRFNDLLEIRDGITSVKNTLPKFMREYAHDIMERIGALINFGFYSLLKLSGNRILEAQLLLQEQIEKAEKGDIAIGTDPTHTQIAKDDPSKPLHEISVKLAIIAVKKVSTQMFKVWQNKKPISSVINEVDKLMQHPAVATWQDKVVLDWANKNPQKVCDASTPSVVIDSIILGLEEMNEFNKKLIKMAEGKAGGVIGKGFTTMDSIIKEYDKDGLLLKNFKDILKNGDALLIRAKKLTDRYEKQYYKPPHCK